MDRRLSACLRPPVKAHPRLLCPPFFAPGMPVAGIGLGFGDSPADLRASCLRSRCRGENLSDRFRTAPGALIGVDPKIFARVEARSRAAFLKATRLDRFSR